MKRQHPQDSSDGKRVVKCLKSNFRPPPKLLMSLSNELLIKIVSIVLAEEEVDGYTPLQNRHTTAAVNRRLRQAVIYCCTTLHRRPTIGVDYGMSNRFQVTVNDLEIGSLTKCKDMVTALLAFNQPQRLKLRAGSDSAALVDALKASKLKSVEQLVLELKEEKGVRAARQILELPFARNLRQLQITTEYKNKSDVEKLFGRIERCENIEILDVSLGCPLDRYGANPIDKLLGSSIDVGLSWRCMMDLLLMSELQAVRLFSQDDWSQSDLVLMLDDAPPSVLSTLCDQELSTIGWLEDKARTKIERICCQSLDLGKYVAIERVTSELQQILQLAPNCHKIVLNKLETEATDADIRDMCETLLEQTGDRKMVEVVLDLGDESEWSPSEDRKEEHCRYNSTVVITTRPSDGVWCVFDCFIK